MAFKKIVVEAPGEAILADLWDRNPTAVLHLESEAPEDHWDRRVAECLQVILQHDGAKADWITQEVLIEAPAIRGPWVMKVFLDSGCHVVQDIQEVAVHKIPQVVSKEMAVAAAGNKFYGHKLLPLLVQHFDEYRLPVNDSAVLHQAAARGSLSTILFLLGKEPLQPYPRSRRVPVSKHRCRYHWGR
ncbi:hypothetical protein QQZ08_007039 [Neonectria magnoliae]|uniref:Uncharacterized protein n=1 Tax=Neonectria magnoliae TaxID=2732573 RepID=A0ABR1HYY3_9HYPO